MIVIKNVSKNYGDFCALREINLELDNGVYGLLAPNGAGKTTLIKMLVTLISPSEGEILYDGKNILAMDQEYRELLGYLPQQFGYYKNYSPKQYLLYLAALKGLNKKESIRIIEDLLGRVALKDVMNKKMRKFSGGMIQRVGIAQALLNNPKVLILDEPTAGLDPKERARFRNMLTELSRDRLIIISTHIVSDVENISKEVIMVKNQQLLYKESVEGICQTLEGAVYEFNISYDELEEYRKSYLILSEKQELDMMNIRFIHKGHMKEGWNSVSPGLEDVFLYEYRDEIEVDM
ncbi:ABC transporter ATP-binding protein [Bacillus suaedae]|uniref:ABC transporter ATP-binding protein n=1 Tax=Halalkalibacter suaedae TaxID=2822140 RepID=A0A940WQQ7_9BACI|nr:ABC transporter ATP-binding protein [Bacillus suaedae]MBP3950959.1 ABC transporter ATP-binding protein [Bacillus suaedae]